MCGVEMEFWEWAVETYNAVPETIRVPIAFLLGLIIGLIKLLHQIINIYRSVRGWFKKDPIPGGAPDLRPEIDVLRDVWLKPREPNEIGEYLTQYKNTKVITVINMKGGVGKTTLTANLGAALSAEHKKRVLFIDYDYQGTLSLMVAGACKITRRDIGANSYRTLYPLGADDPPQAYVTLQKPLQNSCVSGSSYQLFRDEMEQFARWSGDASKYDVRNQLRRFLESESIQSSFDIILVDCGPRFTTSTINALCASTHFLVPTILDEASSQAVTYLNNELSGHRSELFPNLELIGVVPTMVAQDPKGARKPKFSETERAQIIDLEDRLGEFQKGGVVLQKARIPRRAEISRLADRIAYFESEDARRIFSRTCTEVLERI